MISYDSMTVLKEPHSPYSTLFEGKKGSLSHEST